MKPFKTGRMKNKLPLILSLVIITFLGNFQTVFACSISSEIPSFCEMVGSADAIFVGKAIGGKKKRVTYENGVKEIWNVGEIYFEVQEAFTGVRKGIRLTVRSGDEDGYCGTPFKHNESYLIYAFGNLKNGFVDGSRTGMIADTQEDLESLRNLPKVGTGSKIYGNINLKAKSSLLNDTIQPMFEVGLKIRRIGAKNQLFESVTDENGYYEVTKVPAGKYEISAMLSEALNFENVEIEVKDRGCAAKNFLIENKSKISGKVLDADGLPVNQIFVELVPVELTEKPNLIRLQEDDLTDEQGNFTLENVPPGNYTMSINYTTSPDEDDAFPTTFYPNASDKTQALVFNIAIGSKNIENIEFKLPPRLKTEEIKGIIVWSDGTPVFDAHVGLRDAEDDFYVSDMRTDKSGTFTLNGFPGRKYYISADNYSSNVGADEASYVSSEKFVFDKNTESFRLVLEKKTK